MTPPGQALDLDLISSQAMREVMATQFKLVIHPASPDEAGLVAGERRWFTGSVRLEGLRMRGEVCLHLPEAWLDRLNETLGGACRDPAERVGENHDLAGELCNMVAGRICAGLASAGHAFILGTPLVVPGSQRLLEAGFGSRSSTTHWICAGGALVLTTWIR